MPDEFEEYNQIKEKLTPIFLELQECANFLGFAEQWESLDYWRKKNRDSNFTVMILGDFSRGKTMLINALIGEKTAP